MSLSLRLNLLVASVLSLLLAAAGVVIVNHARSSVAEEMDSAVRLTLQLLAAASGNLVSAAGPAPETGAAVSTAPAAPAPDLIRRLARLQDVRHVDITLVRDDGMPPFAPLRPAARGGLAPSWFTRAVAPDPVEYRQQFGIPGRVVEIALRPNPADEIAEAWEESRATFGLLLAFATLVMVLSSFTLHHAFKPIEHIVAALGRLERADYGGARLRDFDLPELRRISTRFNHVVATMARQDEENRELSRQALAIQEAERRHLARELHDELGQSISAIKALAVTTRRRAESTERVRENAATIAEVCDHVYDVVRRLMSELRPTALDSLGLAASLEKLVEDWRARHASVDTRLEVEADLAGLPEDVAIKLFRIVQECLTNVARHAGASGVRIRLYREAGGDRLALDVTDDGRGFAPATARRGLGLLGIRERVASLDGVMQIDSAPGRGTRVALAFPLPAAAMASGSASARARDSAAETAGSGGRADRTARAIGADASDAAPAKGAAADGPAAAAERAATGGQTA